MNRSIATYFPQSVYVSKNSEAEWAKQKQIEEVLSLEFETNCVGKNKSSLDSYVLERPEFKLIKDCIQKELDIIFKDIYKQDPERCKLKITQSWIQLNHSNEYHNSHVHVNSFLSGVAYLDTEENDSIIFCNPQSPSRVSLMCGQRVKHPVQAGDIVIFDSLLPHSVESTDRIKPRISLAFNTWFDGEIGDKVRKTLVRSNIIV